MELFDYIEVRTAPALDAWPDQSSGICLQTKRAWILGKPPDAAGSTPVVNEKRTDTEEHSTKPSTESIMASSAARRPRSARRVGPSRPPAEFRQRHRWQDRRRDRGPHVDVRGRQRGRRRPRLSRFRVVSPVAGPWRHLRDTPQARRAVPGHPRAWSEPGPVLSATRRRTDQRPQPQGLSPRLRRVVYRDPLTTNRYVFVTNNTTWVAKTIADLYKSRVKAGAKTTSVFWPPHYMGSMV